jgi:hypothetical protein
MTSVDHVVISVPDLDDATARWRVAGLAPSFGGTHPWGTANAVVRGPGHAYVELITAGEQDSPIADRVRRSPGPLSWALGVDDIERVRAGLLARGYTPGSPAPSSRSTPDGVRLSWLLCDVAETPMHAFVPFLIQWTTPMPPGPANGPVLTGITVEVPSPTELAAVLVACGLRQVGGHGGVHLTDGVVDVVLREGAGHVSELSVVLPDGPVGDARLDGVTVHRRTALRDGPLSDV